MTKAQNKSAHAIAKAATLKKKIKQVQTGKAPRTLTTLDGLTLVKPVTLSVFVEREDARRLKMRKKRKKERQKKRQ
jgi:hypothetical protein